MNKLRDNAGAVLILLVLSFGVIWVLNDVGLFDVGGARQAGNLIVVDGEGISLQDYQARVAQEQQVISQQNPEAGPQAEDRAAEQAFEALIADKLIGREMDRLGLTVTDAEVRSLITGPNPHPVIAAYFGDGQGGVDRAKLQAFVDDPQAREQLIGLEDYVREARRREKLEGLITATARVSDAEVVAAFNRERRSVGADVVGLRYAAIPDAEVRVSDADVERFYNDHKADYERKKTWDVVLVSASKNPSAQDSTSVRAGLDQLKPRFAAATNDSLFVVENGTERPYSAAWLKPGEVDPALANLLFPTPTVGAVVGPVGSGSDVVLAKVRAVRPAGQTYVHARHILLAVPEADSAGRRSARERLTQLKEQIAGGASFAALARAVSQDPSAAQGGDLGWFDRNQMVKPFSDAAFDAATGSVVGPVETSFGVHLIEVVGRADQEVQLAQLAQRLRADIATIRAAEDRLGDFREFAGRDVAAMRTEAQRLGLPLETQAFADGQDVYPGIGVSPRVKRFLQNAEPGDLSDVIELDDKFVLISVQKVTPEGFRPLSEVREEVRTRALVDAKKTKAIERLRQALAQGGFNGLDGRVPGSILRSATLSGAANEVPGFGAQPRLAGALAATAQGATTPVIAGPDAAFVARATQVTEPAQIPPAERDALRERLLQAKRQAVGSRFLQALRDAADVEDHRDVLDR